MTSDEVINRLTRSLADIDAFRQAAECTELAIAALRQREAVAAILREVQHDDWESMSYYWWNQINKAIGSPVERIDDETISEAKIARDHARHEAAEELAAAAKVVAKHHGFAASGKDYDRLQMAIAKYDVAKKAKDEP